MDDRMVLELKVDREMMRRPHLWPHGSVLPVKRWENGKVETGLLWHVDGEVRPAVMLRNLFESPRKKAEIREYESWDELLGDGWVVD